MRKILSSVFLSVVILASGCATNNKPAADAGAAQKTVTIFTVSQDDYERQVRDFQTQGWIVESSSVVTQNGATKTTSLVLKRTK